MNFMKVLIDLSHIPKKKTGVGIYAYNLVLKLTSVDKNTKFFLLAQSDDEEISKVRHSNISIIRVNSRIFRWLLFRCILEQLIIPLIAIYLKIDVIHSLHYSYPLVPLKVKKIVTIHDLTFFHFPEYHERLKIYYFRLFVRLACKYADRIIAVSASTIKDLVKITKVDKERVELIYLGGHIHNMLIAEGEINNIKRKYGIHKAYFIFVGMIEPRKNIIGLVRAFKKFLFKNDAYQLVIVGKVGWKADHIFHEVKTSFRENQIIFTGYVSEHEKRCLLKGSHIFIYPSKYEGFGLPIIEAMSLSVPTICSNVSSMPEIVGDAAILVNPNKEDDILNAICRLIDSKNEYQAYKDRSALQSKKFTWQKTALRTITAYHSVLK
jgi:glycosyltransferase involved in cell wall biosynthesis